MASNGQARKDGYIDKGDLLLLWNTKAQSVSDGHLAVAHGVMIPWKDPVHGSWKAWVQLAVAPAVLPIWSQENLTTPCSHVQPINQPC